MAKVIDVPGFGPTEFPDDMGDDAIVAVIQKSMIPVSPAKTEPVAGWKKTLGGLVDSASKIVPALKESAESALEPVATIGTGLVSEIAGNIAGAGSGIYSRLTGQPDVSNEVKREFAEALTYQPRSKSAQANLQSIGKFMQSDAGKAIVGLPVAGNELAMLGRLAGPATQQVVRPIAQSSGEGLKLAAQSWMENALKGTVKQAERGDVAAAAKELLKRDLSPNKAGVAAIEARLAQLQEEVAREIAGYTAQINKQKVIDRLQGVRDRFIKTVNPEADLAAISTTGSRFAEHPLIPGETMSAQLAQDLKKGTYQELRNKYGQLGSAETEAQKALARGLKEELDVAIPGIGALNAEEAALYKTLGVAERRQIQEAMKDPLAHSGAYSKPMIYATLALNKSAAAKALLARLLNRAGKALAPEMKAQPAVPSAPTSTLPVPYVREGEVYIRGEVPNWRMPRQESPSWYNEAAARKAGVDIPPDITPSQASRPALGYTPNAELIRPRGAPISKATDAAIEAEILAKEAAARRPASGGMLFDLDPVTGRLRPVDQGLKGATPATVQSTGNNFSSAVEKMSSGRSFSMTPEERIAWSKRKVDLVESVPQFKGLSDEAIAARVGDRAWVANRIKELESEYANWAKESAAKFNQQRVEMANARANTPRVMSDLEKKWDKITKREASRRMELQQRIRQMRDIEMELLDLEGGLLSPRAGTTQYVGQGPKTRAAQRGMLYGE